MRIMYISWLVDIIVEINKIVIPTKKSLEQEAACLLKITCYNL